MLCDEPLAESGEVYQSATTRKQIGRSSIQVNGGTMAAAGGRSTAERPETGDETLAVCDFVVAGVEEVSVAVLVVLVVEPGLRLPTPVGKRWCCFLESNVPPSRSVRYP